MQHARQVGVDVAEAVHQQQSPHVGMVVMDGVVQRCGATIAKSKQVKGPVIRNEIAHTIDILQQAFEDQCLEFIVQ